MIHCSTVEARVNMVSQMMTEPTHGLVSELSRTYHVSRQTLYRWAHIGRDALEAAFGKMSQPQKPSQSISSLVLTLLLETHASYRGIQSTLKDVHGIRISLGTIARLVKEAGQRAQRWMNQQRATTPRALALDEQYSSQRGKAYLNVIDVHSGHVWASIPPVKVDGESWILLWWQLQEQGIHASCTVSDGGMAIHEALKQVQGLPNHQRDVWHILHVAAQVQGRLERCVKKAEDRLIIIQRQAQRVADGKKVIGRKPSADVDGHLRHIARVRSIAEGVGYLSQELKRLLEIVVLNADARMGILTSQDRTAELETMVCLLEELTVQAPSEMQKQLRLLTRHLSWALSSVLLFARNLDDIQQRACEHLGPQAISLLAWAWERRKILGPSTQELLKSIEPAWRAVAEPLFHAWETAVRASSAVENWHSIVRPHLAVHRTLSAEMLALLAVWHNHRIAPRGLHEGLSPLQRTDATTPAMDWLTTLGYSTYAA